MANPTVNKKGQKNNSDVAQKNENTSQKNTKRMRWSDEGVFVGLDKENFIGVVAYNRVDLLIYTESKSVDLVDFIKRVSRHVRYIIDSAKIGSDDCQFTDIKTDYVIGKSYLFQSIYIPYSVKSDKIFNSLSRLKDVENKNLDGKASFSYRKKNVMRIIVDPMKSKSEDVFLKGFIASARIPPVYVDGEVKMEEKFHLRTGTFISDAIGYSRAEIEKINRKELSRNKINLFGENSPYQDHEISYYIPIKRRVSLVIYQADEVVQNGVLNVHREYFELGLHYKTIKQDDGKYVDDFKSGPIGVFVSAFPAETMEISDLRELTRGKDGTTLLYGSDDKYSFDMSTFEDECEILNGYLVSPLEKAEDQPEEPVKEEKEEAEVKEEKDSKKKKSSKKAKAEKDTKADVETTEESESKEEEIPADEETFNDVGSLTDVDVDDGADADENESSNEETESSVES